MPYSPSGRLLDGEVDLALRNMKAGRRVGAGMTEAVGSDVRTMSSLRNETPRPGWKWCAKCREWTALVAKRKCLWCDGKLQDRPSSPTVDTIKS
jgi:hypothetical protein